MKREIKFRAWDEKLKVMLDPICNGLVIHLNGELNSFDGDGEIIGTVGTRQVELLQFTGLHDKNGKEIYEGDIVYALKHNEIPFIRPIVWSSGVLWFSDWNWIEFQNVFRGMEVIGNIYENPELLEVK